LYGDTRMKIGLAIYNFDPKKGGAERYTSDLAGRLAAKGHQVIVFCADGKESPDVTLVRLKTIKYPHWLRNLSFALSHRSALREHRPDAMLGYGNVFSLDVYQSHGGVQRIWMEREIASYGPEKSLKPLLLRLSINQAIQRWIEGYAVRKNHFKRIVAISDMVRDHMSEHFGVGKERFDIVYNGVDIVRFRPAPEPPPGPTVILFCAGNFRLKGLQPLIRAFARVQDAGKEARLLIMGRGNRDPYRRMIDDAGIRDKIEFIGETSKPEDIYRRAHLLVHPTYYDACSLTTMEAMASGLPVITTRWNGASAFVSPEEGFVIDEPDNIDALASAMIALTDPGIRSTMGRNARRKMEQFTMDKNADEIEGVLVRSKADDNTRGNF
jgi:UDP-glucose:(heptosyl)LPS alpha-1,3-glucosyltransferase